MCVNNPNTCLGAYTRHFCTVILGTLSRVTPAVSQSAATLSGLLFFFFSLAYAHPSDSAPSHLPPSDKCDATPSEDH